MVAPITANTITKFSLNFERLSNINVIEFIELEIFAKVFTNAINSFLLIFPWNTSGESLNNIFNAVPIICII